VFASIYGKLSQKNEIFDAEVQAFYKIYQVGPWNPLRYP
jgi:hypothetical protein